MLERQHAVGFVSPTQICVRAIITDKTTNDSWYADRVFTMTYDEFKAAYKKWNSGVLIQDAFPTLTPDEREHMLSAGKFNQEFSAIGDA